MAQLACEHTTVLLNEAVDALLTNLQEGVAPTEKTCFVDATFGRGGHTRLLLARLPANAQVIAFDKDLQAVQTALEINDARFSVRHQAFSHIRDLPPCSVDGLLMDLGVSSPQIDTPHRGFSFRFDGPLDMRMDNTAGVSVSQWLLTADCNKIAEVIRDYGEERFAGSIAKAIDARRQNGRPVSTTAELAQLVADTVKTREPGQNPATRTFQAFRIFINAELEELQQALEASLDLLKPSGVLVVISFHSLEDRIVKQFIAKNAREVFDRRAPFAAPPALKLKALARIKPGKAEVSANPRARSAVMRVAQRVGA